MRYALADNKKPNYYLNLQKGYSTLFDEKCLLPTEERAITYLWQELGLGGYQVVKVSKKNIGKREIWDIEEAAAWKNYEKKYI